MADTEKEEKPFNKLLVLLVSAVLAGAGGNLGVRVIDNPRPDPFTGTDGKQLEARLLWRIERLEELVKDCEAQTRAHNREAESWKRRIVLLEERVGNRHE